MKIKRLIALSAMAAALASGAALAYGSLTYDV